jgi:glycosyltransferase 2 family protein
MAIGMNAPVNNSQPKAAGKSSGLSKVWKTAPGYAIAILCLVWVFHDVRIQELTSSITTINWWWVAGAVLFDVLGYVSQGMRWSLLLHPIGRASAFKATQAIYAGLFVNEVLPMRLGEVLRIYLMSRWIPVRFAAVVPSILVERFFDAIWLALAFGITVFIVPLPKYLIDAEEILGFAALAAAILFIYLVFHRKGDATGSPERIGCYWRPLGWISSPLDKMAAGVRDIGQSRFLYSSFGISLILLLGQILSYWFVMQAYGLELSFWHGAAVFLIVHIGTVIPSAPSNVGTYQFFTVVGLTLFGINKTLATSFSVVVFLILTIPLWLIGLLVFARLGLSLKKIRTEISLLAKS